MTDTRPDLKVRVPLLDDRGDALVLNITVSHKDALKIIMSSPKAVDRFGKVFKILKDAVIGRYTYEMKERG